MTFCKLLAIWSFYYFYYFFMKVLYCLSLKFPGLTSWEWRPPQTGPSFVTEGTVYNFVNVCRSRARTILLWWRANARFKRRTFYEPNLIQQIKLMRSSTFELIKLQLIVFEAGSRSQTSRVEHPGTSTLIQTSISSRAEPNAQIIIMNLCSYNPFLRLTSECIWFDWIKHETAL